MPVAAVRAPCDEPVSLDAEQPEQRISHDHQPATTRWGDGSAHFHLAFMARPPGMMQARGYMLAVWDDVLPRTDPALIAENNAKVAAAMAARGGTALI